MVSGTCYKFPIWNVVDLWNYWDQILAGGSWYFLLPVYIINRQKSMNLGNSLVF